MILVTVGTQDKPFKRLINEIDNLVSTGKIKDEVIMQIGYTPYKGNVKHFDFIGDDEMTELINNADIVITHAGVGSIFKAVQAGKKVIAVPRLKKYREHLNNHQLDILKEFTDKGYILSTIEVTDLAKTIKEAKKFEPKKLEVDNQELINEIEEFIDRI